MAFLNENSWAFDIDFRQDFEEQNVSWGFGFAWRDERIQYKANELDVFDEGVEVSAFLQTTRWWGIRLTLEGENITNNAVDRDRTIYLAERSLSPVVRRELRAGTSGARLWFRASGTF